MANNIHPLREERSVGDLFSDLYQYIQSLVRNEIKLATFEMSKKGTVAGKNTAYVAVGAAMLYAGFLGLMATAALALNYIVPLWLAVLIVTALVLIVGAAFAMKGIKTLKKMKFAPELTIESFKEGAHKYG